MNGTLGSHSESGEIDMNMTIAILTLVSSVLTLVSNVWQSYNDKHFQSSCTIGDVGESVAGKIDQLADMVEELSQDV